MPLVVTLHRTQLQKLMHYYYAKGQYNYLIGFFISKTISLQLGQILAL